MHIKKSADEMYAAQAQENRIRLQVGLLDDLVLSDRALTLCTVRRMLHLCV